MCHNAALAEDLTQDIALQIITALNKSTIPTSFSAWVWQIARNRYSVWAKEKHNRNESVNGSDIGDYEIADESESILDEMIYNLCDNAIKYNKESGTVDVIVNQANGKTSVTVRDTGIGIPQSEQSRVFERFYRVDKSHSKLVGGTGLGLAIVKHGAAYHDAEVSLESTEGKGTSITIAFSK